MRIGLRFTRRIRYLGRGHDQLDGWMKSHSQTYRYEGWRGGRGAGWLASWQRAMAFSGSCRGLEYI